MKNLWLCIFLLFTGAAFAQHTVRGRITTIDDPEGLPGANVIIKGSSNGTITKFDGSYSIDVPSSESVLVYSFIGYQSVELTVGVQSNIDVTLISDSEQLEDVVVTALGIKREKKALGYAIAEVGDEAFESAKSVNPMSALSGRLSGVQVSSTAQGTSGSTSVIIRGTAIASGSNEPLYIVDGVPISNTNFTNGDQKNHGGIDTGNGMSGIAADDIENITVLKGAAATALYGSRAINGVVMITSKSGKGELGTTIDFNSTTTFDQARIYNKWQRSYGQGNFGLAPSNQKESTDNTSMWGAKYGDVNSYTDYRGETSPYQFHDNENHFYDLGVTLSNNVAINHNTKNSTLRFSYSNLHNSGMVPNTEYNRNIFTTNGSAKAWDGKLEITGKLSYITEESSNVAIGENAFAVSLMGTPNNVPLSDLRNYKDPNTGLPIGFGNRNINPYWNLYAIRHNFNKERVLTMGQAKYHINDNLSIMARYGSDLTFFKSASLWPIGTPWYERGRATTFNPRDTETNIDGLITYNKDFGIWGLTVNGGASTMRQTFDGISTFEEQFIDPSLQKPGFGSMRSLGFTFRDRQINSVFGTAQFRYNSFLYFDVSARNDWSSTLPSPSSYFYPSVASSFVFTELMDTPSWFTFGKLRASWAEVGSDTNPYMLSLDYGVGADKVPGNGGDSTSGGINPSTIPNRNLKPSLNESIELGLDLKFFNNRLGIDAAWYRSRANDQIVVVSTSNGSGFVNAIINAGAIENAGVEVSLYAVPVKINNFSWTTTFNYAHNENKVLNLPKGVTQITLFEASSVNVVAQQGEPYGQIIGTKYKRDDNGKILLDNNSRPSVSDELHTIGNAYHKTMLGWINQFQYKNWSATAVLDGKFGGQLYSATEASAYASGRHMNTLHRDQYIAGSEWYLNELEGLASTSTPQELYGAIASINENFIYDASYLAIQELNLTYSLPKSIFDNNKYIRGAQLGLFARNLGYAWRATDNIDPQGTYSIANGAGGVERGNLALPRNYGININLKF